MALFKRFLGLLKKNIAIPIACIAIAAALGIGGAYASYLSKSTQYGSVSSPAFYFESDFLLVGGKIYNVPAGAGSVTFVLKNYADDLRVSDNTIHYTISAENGGTLSASEGDLTGGIKSSVTITLSNLTPGKDYKVVATANAGFEKTIEATFRIAEPALKLYQHTDASDASYVLLTVWAENISGSVNVSFPKGLIPDNTDPVMATVENLVAGVYVAADFDDTTSFSSVYSSHTYRFFKTADYDGATPFIVTMADGGGGIGAIESPLPD